MVLNVGTNPFIALNMTPIDYSITGYYSSFTTLFTPLISFTFVSYYIKKYFENSVDDRKKLKATIIQSLLYFSFAISILCLLALYVYHQNFNEQSEILFSPYALLTIFSIPLTGIYTLQLADHKMSGNSKAYFKIALSFGIISISLSILFIVWIKLGALGKILSIFISNLMFFVLCIRSNSGLFKHKFDNHIFKDMIAFCTPLTIAAMLGFFSNGYDRVILERLGDLPELGIYVVGIQMAGYVGLFSSSIDDTFQPDLIRSVIVKDKRFFMRTVLFKLLLVSGITITFIILAPYIINILTAGRYVPSVKYSRIIALSSITSSIFYAVSTVTLALGRTYISLTNKILTAVLSVFMFGYLIKKWGFVGAAWGIVIMYVLMTLSNLLLLIIFQKSKR